MGRSGDRKQAAAADPPLLHAVTGACRSAFVTVGAFSFCINLLVLTVPIYMVQLFDRAMTSRSEDTLLVLTLAAVATPYVTILMALEIVRRPGRSAYTLRRVLRKHTIDLGAPGRDDIFGWGFVDLRPDCAG